MKYQDVVMEVGENGKVVKDDFPDGFWDRAPFTREQWESANFEEGLELLSKVTGKAAENIVAELRKVDSIKKSHRKAVDEVGNELTKGDLKEAAAKFVAEATKDGPFMHTHRPKPKKQEEVKDNPVDAFVAAVKGR